MSAEGLDELEMKLNQLADIDLKKAVSDAVQTVRSAAMSVHVDTGLRKTYWWRRQRCDRVRTDYDRAV